MFCMGQAHPSTDAAGQGWQQQRLPATRGLHGVCTYLQRHLVKVSF